MRTEPITINGKAYAYDSASRTHRRIEDIATKASDRPANPTADLEPPSGHAPTQAEQSLPFDSPVSITVVSYRTRLSDTDGVSAKAAIDGLVHCGILRDDSAKEVAEVRYRQIKVKNREEEKTVIEIEVVQ